jgi:hypothetical protein
MKRSLIIFLAILFVCSVALECFAQEPPPQETKQILLSNRLSYQKYFDERGSPLFGLGLNGTYISDTETYWSGRILIQGWPKYGQSSGTYGIDLEALWGTPLYKTEQQTRYYLTVGPTFNSRSGIGTNNPQNILGGSIELIVQLTDWYIQPYLGLNLPILEINKSENLLFNGGTAYFGFHMHPFAFDL